MKANVIRLFDALRGSYWFLPMVMTLCSAMLAWGMISIDEAGPDWIERIGWVRAAHPDGARQILSVIGGSMVTVAGTVFSVTIAAVVYASGQYGPRLLSNFMGDRGNQVTLGTFISTFVYCLLVLRTVRSADEAGSGEFVPDLALMIALVLALCSIAVLIYFIHHVPSKLHINSVIADIGEKLASNLKTRFPESLGEAHQDGAPPARDAITGDHGQDDEPGIPIMAQSSGYLQLIDDDLLLDLAQQYDIILRLRVQPGDFLHPGRTIADARPASRITEPANAAIAGAFAVGIRRTALQDIRFLVDELVEIAARALSPGVNDPFTAITCIDWLGAALLDVSLREAPSRLRADKNGALRVVAYPVTFESLVERSFGALSQYCAGDALAALRYAEVLGESLLACFEKERKTCIDRQLNRFIGIAATKLTANNLTRLQSHVLCIQTRASQRSDS